MGPPGGKVIEDLELHAPWKVDFYAHSNGSFVNNTVSQGKDATDLYLTFYFEWAFPQIEAGSEQAKEKDAQLWAAAKRTVQHTVDYARELKVKGEIKGTYEGKF